MALCNCEPIFLRFIKERILFRGGISYGDAYVDPSKSMFFGDAVNKAYKMESEIAIHPRIVIDDYIAEAVLENISSVKYKIVAKNPEYISILGAGLVPKMPGTGEGIIEQDIDEKYIYNYLHFPENNIILQDYYLSGESFIKELIDFCFEQIDRNMNYKIIDKYFYLQRFAQNKLENLLMSSDCDLQ